MPIICTKCGARKRIHLRENPPKGTLERALYCPRCQTRSVAAYKARNPDKVKAHRAVARAKRIGRITPGPCEVCGSTDRNEAHHDDYSAPLVVRWFCRRHHRAEHQRIRCEASAA